ncbi:MAG: glutamine-synthetase adenylyltransferase [Paracoccaceae bacterium]
MSNGLSLRITRHPTAFDPGAGADVLARLPGQGRAATDLIAGTAGCSPYLRALMLREADWLATVLHASPEAVLAGVLGSLDAVPPDRLGSALRQAKRRVALLTALCDLGGVWDVMQVTGALTRLADRAVDLSLKALVADEILRGKLPGAGPDDVASGAGMFCLAMGKMGAGELNYSSDIDLICLFDQDRYGADWHEARAAFIRVTRRMTAMLSDITAEGYVFRTDLRLRPDAGVTPVCLSMAAAETYYEAQGRTWERAAYIKARPCAGDLAAGGRFLRALTPFVWRKHLDFAAIQDAHDMRLRIREHRGLGGPLVVEGHNLKLGLGGIREIEFFTQTRQLIAGGRDTDLRDPTTLGGLGALAEKGWVPAEVAQELSALYLSHRELEHRLQMVGDEQTHDLPVTPAGVARIAAFCGQDEASFRAGLLDRLVRTDRLTEGFFAPGQAEQAPDLSADAQRIVAGWSSYPCLRSDRAVAIFRRLRPQILNRLTRAANPDEALVALDGFLAGLPSGVQIFSLFEANPPLVDLIIDIAATSPALARYLARNAAVLDAVIGGSFFAPWPGTQSLALDLAARLAEGQDYERRLDLARAWMKELHFRIGVHHLRGLIDGFEAAKQYTDLAEAVIRALWPVVLGDFAARHGAEPGRGAVLLGMGSLGAGRLNAGSDLDLILIYDAAGADSSAGPRPLPARTYYARLTQAFVTALSAQTAEGRLYEVDVRLRPSGRQGAVATSIDSYRDYQRTEAWTWEHLALTRARVMTGAHDLADEVETLRRALLAEKAADPARIRADTAEMRARLQSAKPGEGTWEAKFGPGRLMDIELFAQMTALVAASPARQVERQLAAAPGGAKGGQVSQAEQTALLGAYRLCARLQAAGRLLSDKTPDLAAMGEGARAFVLRETGHGSAEELARALADLSGAAAEVIDRHLAG